MYALRRAGWQYEVDARDGRTPHPDSVAGIQAQTALVNDTMNRQRGDVAFTVRMAADYQFRFSICQYTFRLQTSEGRFLSPYTCIPTFTEDISRPSSTADYEPRFAFYDETGKPLVSTNTKWLQLWILSRGERRAWVSWTVDPSGAAPRMTSDKKR